MDISYNMNTLLLNQKLTNVFEELICKWHYR